MKNILILAVVLILVGLALMYVIRAKKKGVKCIGCPEGIQCGKTKCSSCSGCTGYGSCNCRSDGC